jgi:hypothetical protein
VVAERARVDGELCNIYRGVKLNAKAKKYIDGISQFEKEEIFA